MNPSDCPHADAILAHARYRGLDDASLEYEFPFGWHLVSANTAEDACGHSLLSLVIDEMCIAYGGTHRGRAQIAPKKYVEPWSQSPHGPGLPLYGYLDCRVHGERHNSTKHPCCSGIETVDTFVFRNTDKRETADVCRHFEQFGYLCGFDWEGGAVLFLPKFSVRVNQDRSKRLLMAEIAMSLEAALKHSGRYLPRIAAAVLDSNSFPIRTFADIDGAIAHASTQLK